MPPVAGVVPGAGDSSASSVEKVTRYGVSGWPSSHLVSTSSSHSAHLGVGVVRGFDSEKEWWGRAKCTSQQVGALGLDRGK